MDVQRAHDFMRFSFYFWSFAEIADIYFLWFIKFFSSGISSKMNHKPAICPSQERAWYRRVRCCVLISVLADICLRRYIEKTCQGDGQTSTRQITGEVAGEVQKWAEWDTLTYLTCNLIHTCE